MDDKEEMDPFLEEIVVNLDNFIENIISVPLKWDELNN